MKTKAKWIDRRLRLTCKYCDGNLIVDYGVCLCCSDGIAIKCTYTKCAAEWNEDGTLRSGPKS